MMRKVVVIGLDGATFTLLRPWMEQGYLPYLRSLVEHGVSGPLRSSIPPDTVPAWQCFMTGKNPGKHGVPWFLQRKLNSYEEMPISATTCESKTLWELLSENGRRVAVLNVPYAVAPPHFNGILIAGFDTPPSRMAEVTYPPGLLQQIENRFGKYQVEVKTPGLLLANRFEPLIETFLHDCQELANYQFQVTADLLDRDEFDCVMFYQLVPDRIQHWLWYILDDTHPWYAEEVAQRFSDRIVAYYRRLDEQLAKLIELVGPDPTVIVMSDHGFGPVYKGIDLTTWLLQEGYLQIKRRPLSQLKLLLWKKGWGPLPFFQLFLNRLLNRKTVQQWITHTFAVRGKERARVRLGRVLNCFFLRRNDIDWSRSTAYCLSGFGMLRINLQGREPQGVVKPEEYHTVRDEIVTKLRALVDPTNGQPINSQVLVREELYQGEYADQMADILCLALEKGYIIEQPMALPFLSNQIIIEDPKMSGTHRLDGILIAKGLGLRKGQTVEGATLMDLAPTILHLMGCAVPNDMDGRVLTEVFEEETLAEHPVTYCEAGTPAAVPNIGLSQDEQKVILERLKGLGYIE